MAKKKQQQNKGREEYELESREGKMTARIVGREEGMQLYDKIRMIRVDGRNHTYLIMEDFMPVMGEVDRSVELVMEDRTVSFDNIHGFYMHRKNEFLMLVESEEKPKKAEEETVTEEQT